MKKRIAPIVPLLIVVILTACNMPSTQGGPGSVGAVATTVAQTFEAMTQTMQQPLSTPTLPPPPTGTPTFTPSFTSGPTNTPTLTPNGTATFEPGVGSISGAIAGYPYGSIPQLAIVAFEQESPHNYWYLITGFGSTYYSMDGYVSSGTYQVVAYDPSGNSGGCTMIVAVKRDQSAVCDITDWSGSYPSKPDNVHF
jgi:hypothetical protein